MRSDIEALATQSESEDQSLVALRFVANAASAEALVAMAVELEPRQLGEVSKPIRDKIEECKPLLLAVTQEQLPAKALISVPDEEFPAAATSLTSKLAEYFGAISESFAFAQAVPLQQAEGLNEELAKSGYRPVSFRPFRRANGLAASIVWHRDGRGFQVIHGQSQGAFDAIVEDLSTNEAFAPLDVAVYQNNSGQIRFCGLWEERRDGDSQRVIRTKMAGRDIGKIRTDLRVKEKFQLFRNSEALDQAGRCYRATIFEKRQATVLLDVFNEGTTYDGLCLSGDYTDLRMFPMWIPPSEEFADLILSASGLVSSEVEADRLDGLARLAAGHHRFGNLDAAIDACDQVLKLKPDSANEIKRLALLHAAKGNQEVAREWLEGYSNNRPAIAAESLKIRVGALLGEKAKLDELLGAVSGSEDVNELIVAANALAEAAGHFTNVDSKHADKLLKHAREAIARAKKRSPDLELRDRLNTSFGIQGGAWNPIFANTIREAELPHRIDCVYRLRSEHESKILDPSPLTSDKSRELVEQGFVPVVINCYDIADSERPVSNSIWIRYFPTYDETSKLAKRRGNATALLLRTGELDWKTLDDAGMNAATNEALQFLAPDPSTLMQEYRKVAADSDMQCNLLTVLGLAESDLADNPTLNDFCKELMVAYPQIRNHRLLGCIEWFLSRQNRTADFVRLKSSLQVGDTEVVDEPWFINRLNLRMVRVEPGELIIGARTNESERFHLPAMFPSLTQTRERTRFPIYVCAKEITLRQFREFAAEKGVNLAANITTAVPSEDCSVTTVSMVNAAHFCNWLSEKAGIPESQWCYLPNPGGTYDVGMRPAPNFKQRLGYRLPDEVEWEFFARAGTNTIFYWGDQLRLPYMHAETRKTVPPGQYLPNPLGLFDIVGNAAERCQSAMGGKFSHYRMAWDASHTDETPWTRNQPFAVRGGFDWPISRPWPKQCMNEEPGLGLRVVRTAKR